jgi:hypothetical protein
MKRDVLIGLLVLTVTLGLVFLVTREFFLTFYSEYKIVGGFIKFLLLASLGDVISYRIKNKEWGLPTGMFYKMIVWGLIGVSIVLMFEIYPSGVASLQEKGILPFEGSVFAFALFVSVIMNFTFAPTMMLFHRISDSYIDGMFKKSLMDVMNEIDLKKFVSFTVFKTIPLFWVPAHTITFLLPKEYQVIFAAILGIVLGLLLGLFQSKKVVV